VRRLQPHRFVHYLQFRGSGLRSQTADVIGLYLNPPNHARVFAGRREDGHPSADRLAPVLPLPPAS